MNLGSRMTSISAITVLIGIMKKAASRTEKDARMEVKKMPDYSRTAFAAGIVCYNMNNFTKCIVLDGKRGTETDRCSYVMELTGHGDLITHIPPNRALIPTGEFFDLSKAFKNLLTVSEYERKAMFWNGGADNG